MKPEISLPVIAQVSATIFGLALVSTIFAFNSVTRKISSAPLDYLLYCLYWSFFALIFTLYATVVSLELLTETKNPRVAIFVTFVIWAIWAFVLILAIYRKQKSMVKKITESRKQATAEILLLAVFYCLFLAANIFSFVHAGRSIAILREEFAWSLSLTTGISVVIIIIVLLIGFLGTMISEIYDLEAQIARLDELKAQLDNMNDNTL